QFCGELFCTTLPATALTKNYVIVLAPASAASAHAFCTKSYDGGSLVTFATSDEREELAHEMLGLISTTTTTFWIGLHADAGVLGPGTMMAGWRTACVALPRGVQASPTPVWGGPSSSSIRIASTASSRRATT